MKQMLTRLLMLVVLALVASTVTGCYYAGVATTQDGYVVVARNDMFLHGLFRKVFVCQVTPGGLQACNEGVAP